MPAASSPLASAVTCSAKAPAVTSTHWLPSRTRRLTCSGLVRPLSNTTSAALRRAGSPALGMVSSRTRFHLSPGPAYRAVSIAVAGACHPAVVQQQIHLIDQTWIDAPVRTVSAVVADCANWRRWWPGLELTVTRDRKDKGIQWSA